MYLGTLEIPCWYALLEMRGNALLHFHWLNRVPICLHQVLSVTFHGNPKIEVVNWQSKNEYCVQYETSNEVIFSALTVHVLLVAHSSGKDGYISPNRKCNPSNKKKDNIDHPDNHPDHQKTTYVFHAPNDEKYIANNDNSKP